MTLRTKLLTATLAVGAFVLTPSPLTQGQANSNLQRSHIDQSVFADDMVRRGDLDRVDAYAVQEVERLAERTRA